MADSSDAEGRPHAPDRPRLRILGESGGGKTTAGRAIAASLGVPFLELDNIHWHMVQPMYSTYRSPEECAALLQAFLDENPAWVMDGSYSRWSQAAMDAATEGVLIELPLLRRMWRLWRRWWVGRRGLQGGDDARISSMIGLLYWVTWKGRHSRKRKLERLRAAGIPVTVCRTDAELRAYLAHYPGATARFDEDVRRGKREAEAVISGRRRG